MLEVLALAAEVVADGRAVATVEVAVSVAAAAVQSALVRDPLAPQRAIPRAADFERSTVRGLRRASQYHHRRCLPLTFGHRHPRLPQPTADPQVPVPAVFELQVGLAMAMAAAGPSPVAAAAVVAVEAVDVAAGQSAAAAVVVGP